MKGILVKFNKILNLIVTNQIKPEHKQKQKRQIKKLFSEINLKIT